MFYSGIADEAATESERQISAHLELGWNYIELRNINGTCVTDLSAEDFDLLVSQLEKAGLQVSCLASQIANWSRPISSDLEADVAELRQAIPRMKRLFTPFIRCMSYPNADPPWPEKKWRAESIRRMRVLSEIAAEGQVVLVHENCSGWGGMAPEPTLDLLREVNSPHFKLVFDTGNPAQYGTDAWEYYQAVKDHIAYVHIKDYLENAEEKEQASFPGEGICRVRDIVADLLKRGYDGGFSIEPHITSVVHLQKDIQDPQLAYRTYIEYGKKFEKLVEEIKAEAETRA